MFDLQPPRHIPTLPISDLGTGSYDVSFTLESRHGIRQTRPVATRTSDKHRHAKSYRPVKHKRWFTFEGLEACGVIIRRHLFGVGVSKEALCVLRPEAIGEALGSLGAKLEARLSADHAQS
jgi:hypothetical protein